MIFDSGLARWQKMSGLLAMLFLLGALAAFVDAMVGGLRGNSGTIELIPEDRFAISGPMPPKTEAIAEFVIEVQPDDGSVQLIPEAVFSGYWFGGSMWRGFIAVSPLAYEGQYSIVVKDRHGEKQNPALVFSVRIWPDLAAKNAHSPSFLTRKTGGSPYIFAAMFLLCGIAAGCLNFILGVLWARHLASRHCGEIYILRKREEGTEITCELQQHMPLLPGVSCPVYRRSGQRLGSAVIIDCENKKVRLLVKEPKLVKIGDVASFQDAVTAGPQVQGC